METFRIVMTSTFYPPYHLGGDATHVAQLKAELERRGHEVHVLHSLDAFELKRGRTAYEPQTGVHGFHSSLGKYGAVSTYLTGRNRGAEKLLARMLKDIKPDWVHHHNVSLLGQGILKVGKAPKLYTAHDYWLACPRSDLMYLGKELCLKRRCAYCSLATRRPPQLWRAWQERDMSQGLQIIAPSKFMAAELSHFLGIKATVIPNFAPRPRDSSESEASEAYFSFVGVLERSKGLDAVLEGFLKEDVTARLHVMGRGSLENLVRKAEKETAGRISYKGFVTGKALHDEIANSIAMLAPSTGNENSPLACIEALSMGVPLIVSGRGGLPELVDDPECGLVCEPDPQSIARLVNIIMGDSNLVKRLSENALIKYERNHTPERYLDGYLSLCKELKS